MPKSAKPPKKPAGTQSKSPKSPKATKTARPSVITPEILSRTESDLDETELEGSEPGDQESELDPEADLADSSQNTLPVLADPWSQPPTAPEGETGVTQQHNLLKAYLDEVSKYPLLSPEEEFQLAVRLKETGDLDAAKKMVRANLRLVVKIAMEYRSAYQNVLDLIQEGNIGLMKAVSKFDPAKGAKLSYYAGWWIRSYILKYILDNFRLVRVGTTQAQKKLFFHLMREKERLEAQGLNAGPKLLADRLQVREQDVIEMEQRLSGRGAEMSLNNPLDGSGDEGPRVSHMDMLVDQNVSPDERLADSELKEILKSRLEEFAKTLKEKELAVFRERLASDEPKTLQEVADMFGLTRERARQIEARVIEKLREYYKQFIR